MSSGARNLLILGVLSAVIALTTTGVSLAIYHNSGDIYLDRSRPGFLPGKEEIEDDKNENDDDYKLNENTVITTEILDEYLKSLNQEIENIDTYKDPFSSDGLSDSRLGL